MSLSLILLFLQLWRNVDVSLTQNVCSNPPDVIHAHVSEETKKAAYQQGDVIVFACEPGYISSLTSKYVCTSRGWIAVSLGTCYSCSALPNVPHARVSEETRKAQYQQGDTVHFTCEPGYISSLTSKYVCTSGGWLPVMLGTCYSLTCEPPPTKVHTVVRGLPENEGAILPDHILTFSCDGPATYLNGSSVLICRKDGTWDNPFPSCDDTCAVTGIPDSVHMITHVEGGQVRKGQKLRFECHGKTTPILQGNEEVECLTNGQWSGPFPTCRGPSGCGLPPPLADGDIKDTLNLIYRHNQRAEYMCQNFYTMAGGPFRTCIDGEWTGDIRCLSPCTVDRMLMNSHNIQFRYTHTSKLYTTHGDRVAFSCVAGRTHDRVLDMNQYCNDGVMLVPTCF